MAITASITMEAVKDLDLKAGDDASAIIKASDVIVGQGLDPEVSRRSPVAPSIQEFQRWRRREHADRWVF